MIKYIVWWRFFFSVDWEFIDQSPGHHEAVWLRQRHYCGTLPRLQLVCSQEIYGGRWGKKCINKSSPSTHPALCYINISTRLTSSWHHCPLVGSFCHSFDCDSWIVTIIVEIITLLCGQREIFCSDYIKISGYFPWKPSLI